MRPVRGLWVFLSSLVVMITAAVVLPVSQGLLQAAAILTGLESPLESQGSGVLRWFVAGSDGWAERLPAWQALRQDLKVLNHNGKGVERVGTKDGIPIVFHRAWLVLQEEQRQRDPDSKPRPLTFDMSVETRAGRFAEEWTRLVERVHEAGSLENGVLAQILDPIWIGRVVMPGDSLVQVVRRMRTELPGWLRQEAEALLCGLVQIAELLEARSPFDFWVGRGQPETQLRFSVARGSRVVAPLDATVTWEVGQKDGLCLALDHACGMLSVVCGFESVAVQPGALVLSGWLLGLSGPGPMVWELRASGLVLAPLRVLARSNPTTSEAR